MDVQPDCVDDVQLLRQQTAVLERRNCELRAQVERMQRELDVTHELTVVMHASPDTGDVQDKVLSLVTGELGFERAVLSLFDPHDNVLTGWLQAEAPWRTEHQDAIGGSQAGPALPIMPDLPLTPGRGPIALVALNPLPQLVKNGEALTCDPILDAWLGTCSHAVLPLILRGRLLGVLIVDNPRSGRHITEGDMALLSNIAMQASLVLGSLQLCIDRTQRMAVEAERSRIAMEMHDHVSQHLYGMAYALDASIKLLPEKPDLVRQKLAYLLPQVQAANAAIRQTIFDLWPEEFDADRFAEELRKHAAETAHEQPFDLAIRIDPHFASLPLATRKHLYMIVQEALSNIIKHAEATCVEVTLEWTPVQLHLTISDDGRGFNAAIEEGARGVRAAGGTEGFGMSSMSERAHSLGGRLQVMSGAAGGTRVDVTVPLGVG